MIFRGYWGYSNNSKIGCLVQSPVSNIYTPRKELIYTRLYPNPPEVICSEKDERQTERHISRKTWEDMGIFTELVTNNR